MPRIPVNRLQPGVFVTLSEVGWLDHPFLLNRFRIADAKQVQVLRSLGLKDIEWDPARSTVQPLPEAEPADEEVDFAAGALDFMLDAKRQRAERVRQQREGLARCERLYEQETQQLGDILRDLASRPNESGTKAKSLVGRVVGGLIQSESVAVHLVNLKAKEAGLAHHSMNVMVLALLIGRAAKAAEEDLRNIGLGALLHDIGKRDIPPLVLRNPARTPAEEQFYRAHVGYGIKNISALPDTPVAVRNVVACHHERWDGKGFPNALAGGKIPLAARAVAIANRYDNLCNPFDLKTAKTPAEAVAQMFGQEAGAFDPDLLQLFIKSLGVYPPGSFVALSNGTVGLVVETNTRDLLKPVIMVYDAGVPRSEALLLDLGEAGVTIESAVSPAKLPVEVVEYLAPRGRIDYYVEGAR